ncbi:phosphoglycerate dehydrogenase-like oxidoreductase [Burkholderia sp. Ch1-1]|nr:phosphoglycerate dehydrogenase-like oxidoreductase [Burkholderia sp. Ch1-1]
MTEPARRYRLHLESQRRQSPPFHLHEAVWQVACARHPDLAQQIDVTFGWDGERFARPLDDVDFLLASRFPHEVVNDAPRLRWIHTTGAGVDQLMPLDRLRRDLILTNSSGIHSDKAAEYTQMALLMLNAQLPAVLQAQREHRWDARLTTSIRGKTALIIGFGDLGMAASHAARALGLRVIALNRSGAAPAQAVEAVDVLATISALDDWLPQADFVVITAPLTPQTRDLLSAARLARMRPGAGVVNLSRAALIDHAALFERLRSGECGGALLDVFDPEPLPADHVAWDVAGLVVTPHISCDAPDYNLRVLELWFANFARLLRGEALANIVDRTRGY